ncbi:hypothetical protein ACH4D3_37505 [Streptomyces sp. NPDC018026]|uniref:hypothetical protein n=1 Tax=Streptomyces sp. NPDC018026 TaxID=3365031 RepID=UPI0037A747A2
MGILLKNARAAARKMQENEQRRATGLPLESSAGALSDERREQLEEIDASWCPEWPVSWQQCFHLVRINLDTGEALPTETDDVVRQCEDVGRWVQSMRLGWDQLTAVQQWMCEQVFGIGPATEDEKPKPRRTQADKWAMHTRPPGSSTSAKDTSDPEGARRTMVGEDQEDRKHKLGAWIGNQRSRAATLTPELMELLSGDRGAVVLMVGAVVTAADQAPASPGVGPRRRRPTGRHRLGPRRHRARTGWRIMRAPATDARVLVPVRDPD